ncbi:MAG: hypothetical protein IKZ13_08590 [Akkermansia sp.]|nr:hypothetical protein [Akkermansia sp.]
MKYFTGTCFNFSAPAQLAEVVKLRLGKAGELGGLYVAGATFAFEFSVDGGVVEYAAVEHGEEAGVLWLSLPAMEAGEYVYELSFTDALGEQGVVLHGIMSVLSREQFTALVENAERSEVRELLATVGSLHGAPLELRWAASSAAARFAADAAEAAKKAEEVLPLLQQAKDFLDSFNKALREVVKVVDNYLYIAGENTGHYVKGDDGITPHIGADGYWYVGEKKLGDRPAFGKDGLTPYITSDGYWAIGDMVTTARAQGKDGIDGTAVRRILVDSYADIPQSGPTCNGGYYYYVLKKDIAPATGWIRIDAAPHRLNTITINGTVIRVDRDYAGHELWVQLINEANCGVIAWEDGNYIRMQAVDPGEEGNKIAFSTDLIGAVSGATLSGGMGIEGSYDVYAWVEHKNGVGRWVRTDLAYDIATTEIFGLTKLSSDMVFDNGAPVATNSARQMVVPPADLATPGAAKLSTGDVLDKSRHGDVGFSEDGALMAKIATGQKAGALRPSYTGNGTIIPCIGFTDAESGGIGVPRAAAFDWGVSRVGTSVPQSLGMPWIIPVGMAATGIRNEYGQDITGQLMNNVLYGGALRTYTKGGWQQYTPPGIDPSRLPDNSNAVGISTSVQFYQDAANGLNLTEASATVLAGVFLAEGRDDIRAAAVLTAGQTAEFYYNKELVYTKAEVMTLLTEYLKKAEAEELYATCVQLNELSAAVVHKTATWHGTQVMTEEEYNALGEAVNDKILYVLV